MDDKSIYNLTVAVRECIAGGAILAGAGWAPEAIFLGIWQNAEGAAFAGVSVCVDGGHRSICVAPLTAEEAKVFPRALQGGRVAWRGVTYEQQAELVAGSAVAADAINFLAAFGPPPATAHGMVAEA